MQLSRRYLKMFTSFEILGFQGLEFLMKHFRPVLLYIIVLMLVQHLMVHFIFLQRDEHGKRVFAIDNRLTY